MSSGALKLGSRALANLLYIYQPGILVRGKDNIGKTNHSYVAFVKGYWIDM